MIRTLGNKVRKGDYCFCEDWECSWWWRAWELVINMETCIQLTDTPHTGLLVPFMYFNSE